MVCDEYVKPHKRRRMSEVADSIGRVFAPGMPKPKNPYVHATVFQGVAYCSGQIGVDPASGEMAVGVAEQTRQTLKNVEVVLAGVGSDLTHVLRAMVYLREQSSFDEMNAVYAEVFGEHLPARTTLPGIGFRAGVEVEIDVTAVADGFRQAG
jgi:2-iminobutanoate/2-iminopropanoate deaminase